MTAFPTQQRASLTRLRELHPRARLQVPIRQPRPVMRVVLRWPARNSGETSLKRTAYIFPDGYVRLTPRSTRNDRQKVTA